jgi:signal transduction histidine kinase/sugar phosphate isomerase/epimerase
MKLGYQTIIWGERISNFPHVLDCIAAAGFQGIEIAQRTDSLGFGERFSFDDLRELLAGRGLELVGLAGGSLEERKSFCGPHSGPHYLCAEDWSGEASIATLEGNFTIALHPHAYMAPGRLSDTLSLLDRYHRLKWIPDTAHLHMLGEDSVRSLGLLTDRIASIHLKAWTAAYGRSPHRYSRGFTELGRGDVPLDAVVRYLQETNYGSWLIVEQDYTRTSAEDSLFAAAEWLCERRLLPRRPQRAVSISGPPAAVGDSPIESPATVPFSRRLHNAVSRDIENCYRTVASVFAAFLPCRRVSVWIPSLAHGILSLAAVEPCEYVGPQVLNVHSCLTAVAIDRHAITSFALSAEDARKNEPVYSQSFYEPALAKQLAARGMITIPIFSACNGNHTRLAINVFTPEPYPAYSDQDLASLSVDVAHAIDAALDRTCADAAASTAHLSSFNRSLSIYAHEIASLIARTTSSEGCSIFFANGTGDAIDLIGTTGIHWREPDSGRSYRRGEGLTGLVWQIGRVKVAGANTGESNHLGKSYEVLPTNLHSSVWVPLLDSKGTALGVVRCQNKRVAHLGGFNIFSNDDVAIIEAIAQIAVPQLESLLAEERRREGVARLVHELQRPATAIRSAVHFMNADLDKRVISQSELFANDYLGDVKSWSELMIGLVENADFYGKSGNTFVLTPAPTFFMKDIIAPAVRQVDILLRNRRLASRSIQYGRLSNIPQLWIDRSRFQQVMFNLLSNAIKYAYRDPSTFHIEIDGERLATEYKIYFRDWGEGVPEGFERRIFQLGFRAPRVGGRPIAGQGFGLWIVNSIVRAHGGRVAVTSRHLPTEFSIFLPISLDKKPPDQVEFRI